VWARCDLSIVVPVPKPTAGVRRAAPADGRDRGAEARYGYRRIHVLLRREGWEVSRKKTYRLHRELARAHPPRGILDAAPRVADAGVVEGALDARRLHRRNLDRQRRRRDLVVDVDLVQHREADDAPLVLADVAVMEARLGERHAVPQVVAMRDRGLHPVEVGKGLVEPLVGVTKALVDRLVAFDFGVVVVRLARRLVLHAQLVEYRWGRGHGSCLEGVAGCEEAGRGRF